MTAFSKTAKITALVAFLPTVFASFLFTGCLQRDFSESKSKAITLRGQDATSRLYMAYDEAAPMRLTWFLCEGDPASTSSVIQTRARSADAPVMAAGRVARKRPLLPAILPSRAQTSPSSALESGPLVERYVDERMTIAEFRDPTLGKGCKDVLTAEGSASVSEIADETAARLAKEKEIDELGPQIFGTVASCSGIVKETLLIASVLLSADKTNVRSLFGFKGTAVAPGNRGSQLVGLFSGTAFCALSTRSLFNQLATGQGKVSVSDAQFLSYLQKSNDVADALFVKGAESSQASGLPQDVVDAIRADKAQFDRLISENRQMEAAGLFNPYRVGIWNFVLNANVDATHSNAANLTTYAGAFFAGLRKRLIDPLFGAGHNTH